MIIAQISDSHILARASDRPEGAARAEALRRCVADINAQGADAVVHTGDSVQNGLPEEYTHLREILDALQVPYFPVPGNRDRHGALRAAFHDLSCLPGDGEFLHYTVEDLPVRLVALDSVVDGERKGVFCAQRLAWLDETLAADSERPTLLFMHHPPFDIAARDYVGGYRRRQDAEDLAAVVSRHPQIVRLLCGHVHCPHREEWAGTVATTMPSVAVDLRKGVEESLKGAPLYLLHIATPDGELVSHIRVID